MYSVVPVVLQMDYEGLTLSVKPSGSRSVPRIPWGPSPCRMGATVVGFVVVLHHGEQNMGFKVPPKVGFAVM